MSHVTYKNVKADVLSRIHSRRWPPGHAIPTEKDLAAQFGCARATVNRALRELAEAGVLDRKRKAGTRVVVNPARKATLTIPIVRHEVEAHGHLYRHRVVSRAMRAVPLPLRDRWGATTPKRALHLNALHLSDERPYAFEDRWINPHAVPDSEEADFDQVSINEWLVQNAPFTHGDIALQAEAASEQDAQMLKVSVSSPLFVLERATYDSDRPVTFVRLAYPPTHRMNTKI